MVEINTSDISQYSSICDYIITNMDGKLLDDDEETWINLLKNSDFAPLQYKPSFIKYQTAYFKDIYEGYTDISYVLYKGGNPVGIWPLSIFKDVNGELKIGSLGGDIIPPLLIAVSNPEKIRNIFEQCLTFLKEIANILHLHTISLSNTIMSNGVDLWSKKLMEHNSHIVGVKHILYIDLSQSIEDIQKSQRRTNRYSVTYGKENYIVNIYDETSDNIESVFAEFQEMHLVVSGRKTRSQLTWDLQEKAVKYGNEFGGYSFVIFIRDKITGELAGAALFDTTHSCGLYCVAVYDRLRFKKPVSHIVQAIAIDKMKRLGVRWYEIGERTYPSDVNATEKTVNIGFYKEGFATHTFLRVQYELTFN